MAESQEAIGVTDERIHHPQGAPGGGGVLKVEVTTVPAKESVELLDGGDRAYPAMLSAIAHARTSVDLEVYTFAPLGVGARFVEALGNAARRGVAVRVVIDGWGSARRGRAVAKSLREAGCAVRIYHRLLALLVGRFGRNHRKLLIVDDEIAFLGGINIGDENVDKGAYLGWADLALAIRGPRTCARLGAMMRREALGPVNSSLRIHLCGLGGGWRLRRRYIKMFADARSRVHIAHGYFLPDRGVVRAITSAARRFFGVQVRLLLAGRSDIPFARAAARSLYRRLLAAGVVIHEWNESVLHAKVATVDGHRLLLGSFNLDPFSLANLETLVEVNDHAVVPQTEAWIQEHMERSHTITSLEAGSRLRRWLLDPLGRLVARFADATSRVIVGQRRRRASRDYGAADEDDGACRPPAKDPP